MISIANKIAPSCSSVERSMIVFVWFLVLLNRIRIVPFNLGSIVGSIQITRSPPPSGSCVDRSWIIFVWFLVLINRLRIGRFNLGSIVASF